LVAPSILSADFGNLARDVKAICDAGCDLVHVDVMDGHFVPNLTIGPVVVEESENHANRLVQKIKSLGIKPAVVLNPHTPIESIEYLLEDLHMVLLMSVNPGFGGQKFIPSVIEKASKLKELILKRNLECLIEVDGGPNGLKSAIESLK